MSTLSSFEIYSFTTLNQIHKDYIYKIWNNEYPVNLAFKNLQEVDNYLNNLIDAKHFFVVNEHNQLQGWAVIFERDYEKWFAIIIESTVHHLGLGRKILNRLKTFSTELNGWVIDHQNDIKANGEPYHSPLAFYLKNDFVQISETRLELNKISAVKINWRE
ncbi:N-acetyltransferase [Empedobacter brevis]|uniref:N-acetyltransferase n=1 Tax=Empedobacter brevis TaxID=247 RepID=UPI0028AA3A4F|nr:N-acetyltransferase [Empedobacter brevis]